MTKNNGQVKIAFNVHGFFTDVKTGKITDTFEGKNLVVDSGLESLAARLAGLDTPINKRGTITYCAVGTEEQLCNLRTLL